MAIINKARKASAVGAHKGKEDLCMFVIEEFIQMVAQYVDNLERLNKEKNKIRTEENLDEVAKRLRVQVDNLNRKRIVD